MLQINSSRLQAKMRTPLFRVRRASWSSLRALSGRRSQRRGRPYDRIESIAIVGTAFGGAEDVAEVGWEEVVVLGGVLAEFAIDADEFCAIGRGKGLFFKFFVEDLPLGEETIALFDVVFAEKSEDG